MAASATDTMGGFHPVEGMTAAAPAGKADAPAKRHAPFSARGRLGVIGYNARALLAMAAMVALMTPMIVVAVTSGGQEPGKGAALAGLPVLLTLPLGVYMVLVAVRRMHDLDRSGWFLLIGLVPVIGQLWALYYTFVPGTDGPNRFGEVRGVSARERAAGVLGTVLAGLCFAAMLALPLAVPRLLSV